MDIQSQRRRQQRAFEVPFLNNELMVGPPGCCAKDFALPRLRQCPFALSSLSWEAQLGGGLDGYVWKVRFGNQGPFALKVVSMDLPYHFLCQHI